MASRSDDYRFLQLVDAMASINQKVNLIGVVVETSIPKQSKGTGNSLSLSPRIMNHEVRLFSTLRTLLDLLLCLAFILLAFYNLNGNEVQVYSN